MAASRRQRGRGSAAGRRGVILPLALLVIGLLAVLAAQVVFRSNADVAATQATEAALQARLAAEAGIQKAIAVLQWTRADIDSWYDNPDAFQARVVRGASTSGFSEDQIAQPERLEATNAPVWRFSLVSPHPGAATGTPVCRFGITDEASKLNINTITAANRDVLERLIAQLIRDPEINQEELVDSLIDWRDKDDEALANGAEAEYYLTLDYPYQPANGDFGSVEELLLVRGWTGRVLYGEDWNRNGILDPSEDDGDASFPPDNGDGQLDPGLYPYLTVWSSEPNTTSQNKPKIDVNYGNREMLTVARQLSLYFTTEQITALSLIKQQVQGGLQTPLDLILKAPEDMDQAFGVEDLPLLLDVFKSRRAPNVLKGMVNVNTAPVPVLVAVGFTDEEARKIVSVRQNLTVEDKTSLAWLVTQGVVDLERLAEPTLFNRLTVRSFQFTVESVGFADHVGTFCRLQATITMNGPVAQIGYWRDLSSLGLAWPVRSQEGMNVVVSDNR